MKYTGKLPQKLFHILTDLKNSFNTGKELNFQQNLNNKFPLHLKQVAILPCEMQKCKIVANYARIQ